MNETVYLIAGKRTPFGKFGGALAALSATDLAVLAAQGALEAARVSPEAIDSVVFGNVQQTSADAPYLARHVGLRTAVPVVTPALTLNRLCGSGLEAVLEGARQIRLGEAVIVLAGGTESMSQAPHVARGLRQGLKLGKSPVLEDSLFASLTDGFCKLAMGETAERLAQEVGIGRELADRWALRSQQRTAAAQAEGRFRDELLRVDLPRGRSLDADEHPRAGVTLENLAALSTVFAPSGVVTAGNASGICDGATALVVASETACKRLSLTPLARLVSAAVVGVPPETMGIGPVPALNRALTRAGRVLEDCDLIEINEAFAAQVAAVVQGLGLDTDTAEARVNIDGGAIALGHPLGASGARILLHLALALRDRKGSLGAASACIGGGQGIAALIERC